MNVFRSIRSALVVEETDEHVSLGAAFGSRRRALRYVAWDNLGKHFLPKRYYSMDFSDYSDDDPLATTYCYPIIRWREREIWRGKRQLFL
jgi:hypothetical protein